MAHTIKVHTKDGQVHFAPAAFLGSAFPAFRTAMTDSGVRAVRSGTTWINSCPVPGAPRVVAALQQAGFTVSMDETTRVAISGAVQSAQEDVQGAQEILANIERSLAARGRNLYRYQREGVLTLLGHRAHILGDDMGLGKTLQMLCTIPAGGSALVVCPALVKGGFAQEVRTWRPDLTPVILSGRGSFRLPAPGEVVITNYEILPGEREQGQDRIDLSTIPTPPQGLIMLVDEIHRCGASKTLVTGRIAALASKVLDNGGRVYGATGTLMRTKPENVWNILRALRLTGRAFGTWDGFVRAFGGWQDRFGYQWPAQVPAGASQGLAKVMIRRRKDEVAQDMPAVTEQEIPCEAPASLLRTLDKVQSRVLAKLQKKGAVPASVTSLAQVPDEVLAKAMAEGAESIGEIAALRETIALAKVPTALAMVEDLEAQGEPMIVFSAHVGVAEQIGSRKGWALITGAVPAAERSQIVADFQAGKYLGVAGTIGAMGVGVTMTRAAMVMFVDKSWTPAENAQARDRVHRHGQTRPVTVLSLVVDHDIDRRIAEVLSIKTERNAGSVEAASVGADYRAPELAMPDMDQILSPPALDPVLPPVRKPAPARGQVQGQDLDMQDEDSPTGDGLLSYVPAEGTDVIAF